MSVSQQNSFGRLKTSHRWHAERFRTFGTSPFADFVFFFLSISAVSFLVGLFDWFLKAKKALYRR